MTSRRPAEGAVPMPERWDRDDDGRPRCVACQRAASGDGARAKGATAAARRRSAEVMAEARRAVLAHPDPGTNEALAEIAEEVGCSVQKARAARTQLVKRGEVVAPAAATAARGRRGPAADKGEAIRRLEEALRRDHRRSDREVAEEAGVARSTVSGARGRLGLRWDRNAARQAETLAALGRLGDASVAAVAGELGIATFAASSRLSRLVEAGRAERVGPARQGKAAVYRVAPGVRAPT
jgi:hypothetical protein